MYYLYLNRQYQFSLVDVSFNIIGVNFRSGIIYIFIFILFNPEKKRFVTKFKPVETSETKIGKISQLKKKLLSTMYSNVLKRFSIGEKSI